jgi:hypothetical protein
MINQNGENNSLNTGKDMYKPNEGIYIPVKGEDGTIRLEKVLDPYEIMCKNFKSGQIQFPTLGGSTDFAAK